MRPFILYHWAPLSRCASIKRRGLRVGRRSRDGVWKAPYICFSDSPSLAWALSAQMQTHHKRWGLFMVWSTACGKLKRRTDMPGRPTEFRARADIAARHLWFVGSRSIKQRKRR